MKIQCEVCEKAEAEILCCADEAVLCKECDAKVHAANKLSSKHQRVALLKISSSSSSSSSSHMPLCDKCKERNGYFFCLEDRAIFCRHCDVSTHKASPYLASHQRFLIAGMKVSLQSINDSNETSAAWRRENCQKFVDSMFVETSITASSSGEANMEATEPCWSWNEIFGPHDFNCDFSDMQSCKITGNDSFT